MIADDLFAGAGGWDLAAEALGIHARGIENMPAARATRDAAGLTTIHDDVWTYRPDGQAKLQVASAPCPPWSQAGKKNGVGAFADLEGCVRGGAYLDLKRLKGLGAYLGDDRVALVLTPLHFAMTGSYRLLAWEQVKGVLPIWELCAEELTANGWNVWTGKVHCEQFGVPQTRERALLLASLDGPVEPPAPTHSRYYPRDPGRLDPDVLPWISMADGLEAAGCDRWGLTERPSPTITGGGTETGGAEPIAKIVDRWTTRPNWCYRRPSTTIVGSFKPEVVAAPGYRTTVSRQNAPNSVRVTVAEAGVLQSFPADFPWQGAKGKQHLQAGNAFPPRAAMHALAAATGLTVPSTTNAEENVA